MELANKKLSKVKIGLLIFGVHTFLLIIKIIPDYLFNLENPEPGKVFSRAVLFTAVYYYLLALTTLPIMWAGLFLPFGRSHLKRNIVLHFLYAIALGAIHFYGYGLLIALILNPSDTFRMMYSSLASTVSHTLSYIPFYATITAFQQAYLYFRQLQEREIRLRQAELDMLKSQLQPHFLFNALNAISTLVHKSPQDADTTLMQLSDLLRVSLKNGKTQEVTLREEMDFLQSYLQIHQTLMKQRLEIKYNIQSETLDAMIPNMILQPIVENAIKHGLAPLARGGRVEISAQRYNGTLNLLMADNGKGANGEKWDTGIGLSNTRARLRSLYGAEHKIEIQTPPGGGFAVEIEIPFREQKVVGAE